MDGKRQAFSGGVGLRDFLQRFFLRQEVRLSVDKEHIPPGDAALKKLVKGFPSDV